MLRPAWHNLRRNSSCLRRNLRERGYLLSSPSFPRMLFKGKGGSANSRGRQDAFSIPKAGTRRRFFDPAFFCQKKRDRNCVRGLNNSFFLPFSSRSRALRMSSLAQKRNALGRGQAPTNYVPGLPRLYTQLALPGLACVFQPSRRGCASAAHAQKLGCGRRRRLLEAIGIPYWRPPGHARHFNFGRDIWYSERCLALTCSLLSPLI